MGEPVEFDRYLTEEAFDTLEDVRKELETDKDEFSEFVDAVHEKDFAPRVKDGIGKNETPIDVYRDKFYSNDSSSKRVKFFAKKFDLSMPAADLFDELANVSSKDDGTVLNMIKMFEKNDVNDIVMGHFKDVEDNPVAMRELIAGDLELEKASLWNYKKKAETLYSKLDEINREYGLPVKLDDSLELLDKLDEVHDRADRIISLRRQEIKWRPEYMEGKYTDQEQKFYDEESFERPVIEEMQNIKQYTEKARENIVVKF